MFTNAISEFYYVNNLYIFSDSYKKQYDVSYLNLSNSLPFKIILIGGEFMLLNPFLCPIFQMMQMCQVVVVGMEWEFLWYKLYRECLHWLNFRPPDFKYKYIKIWINPKSLFFV